jgi:hypothetical protein
VLNSGVPSFLIPIRHGFATELFDASLAEGQLFARRWDLGLRRELVYYRSPKATPRGFAAPARILWYVSGSQPGSRYIRAVSQLTEVAVGDHRQLFNRFKAYGVFDYAAVAGAADTSGRVMALRFSQARMLPRPVSLEDYRELVTGDRFSPRVALQSPQPVDEQVFVSVLEIGGADV